MNSKYKINISYKLLNPQTFFYEYLIIGNFYKKMIYFIFFLNNIFNNIFIYYPRIFRISLLSISFLGGVHLMQPFFCNVVFFKVFFYIIYIQVTLNTLNRFFDLRWRFYKKTKIDLYCLIGNMDAVLSELKLLTPKIVGALVIGSSAYHIGDDFLITQNINRFNSDILPLIGNNSADVTLLENNKKIICSVERDLFTNLVNNHGIDSFINLPRKSSLISLASQLELLLIICDCNQVSINYGLMSDFENLISNLNASINSTNHNLITGDADKLITTLVLKYK